MYAIKIVNDYSTVFHLAEELSYSFKTYKGSDEFFEIVDKIKPTHQLGDPLLSGDIDSRFLDLTLLKNDESLRELFIMSPSRVYIMQDGKTIEVINV